MRASVSAFDRLTAANTLDEAGYKRQRERLREKRTELTRKLGDANEHLDDARLETARTTLELAQGRQDPL